MSSAAVPCPCCGVSLRLVADVPDQGEAERDPKRRRLPRGRPRKLYRGSGPERESAWGAVLPCTKRGRSWLATVAALVGDAGNDEAVCELAGATWKPDPEDRDDDGPDDPAWLTDTSGDVAPGQSARQPDLFAPAETAA